jgi:hypothetical protein
LRRRTFIAGLVATPVAATSASVSEIQIGEDIVRLADILVHFLPEEIGAAVRAPASVEDVLDRDRWKRRVAIVRLPDGRSVQEVLVERGFARVNPESRRSKFISALLEAESKARAERQGLWKSAYFRVRDANRPEDVPPNDFRIVEGVVAKSAIAKSRAYVNFGADYMTDFTATLTSRGARSWVKKGVDVAALGGRRVRVRGYVAWINGPSVELTHPQQIELL